MPRTPQKNRDEIIEAAMHVFWRRGYGGLTMDQLVRATGVSRYALYDAAGGKRELYLAALRAYQRHVVSPAFERVEADGAGREEIRSYFLHQISAAETAGLPGPGCLVANAATETAPYDPEIADLVRRHDARLTRGFRRALAGGYPAMAADGLDRLAAYLAVTAQGLWSYSRMTDDPARLRRHAETVIDLIDRAGASSG